MKKKSIGSIITWIVTGLSVVIALYIMYNHLGLVESLDFGAGAYYYADIPQFQKYVSTGAYQNTTPAWIIVSLFFIWGWLMYKLWSLIEGKR